MGENKSINSFIHIGWGYLTLGIISFCQVTRQSLVTLANISDPLGEIFLSYMNTHDGFL